MAKTKIEWATHSWNPVTGCTPVSEGCQNCYAQRIANRLRGRCGYPADDPFRVTLHPERLGEPLRWRKPSRVFVCSMGDLFHPDVQPIWLSMIFNVIRECPQHTFMVLTKRPEIALEHLGNAMLQPYFGLPNLWIGVTAENQQRADERIPILLQIPAVVRFVSVEPMLGQVDLTGIRFDRNTIMNVLEGCGINRLSPCQSIPNAFCEKIDWVICGSESGPNHRKTKIEWIRDLREQCISANVPFFLKQMEINGRMVKMPELDGKIWAQFPEVKP